MSATTSCSGRLSLKGEIIRTVSADTAHADKTCIYVEADLYPEEGTVTERLSLAVRIRKVRWPNIRVHDCSSDKPVPKRPRSTSTRRDGCASS